MELTIRTSYGSADVAIRSHEAGATLREVLAITTGQAPPSAVLVDRQLVDTSATISSLALLDGSVIDTDLDGIDVAGAIVNLVQVTGPGAGTQRPLPPGRYRVGPGARQSTAELEFDAVDAAAFEIDVHPSGALVSAPDATQPVMLDGTRLSEGRSWTQGDLIVEGRVFMIEPKRTPERPAAVDSTDGKIILNRPPGVGLAERRYLIDAVLDAAGRRVGLWHRRPSSNGMPMDVGVVDSDGNTSAGSHAATIDLVQDGVVAVAGRIDDSEAVLRSMLIEALTRYGPADLSVSIAVSRDQLEAWDWAKWLPHARRARVPEILANELEVAAWATRISADDRRRSLLVITDDRLWNHAAAPLRPLVTDRPDHVTIFALCDTFRSAPTTASSVIELDDETPGRAQLIRVAHDARSAIRVGLADVELAADVARHLAALIDPDLALDETADDVPSELTLADIVHANTAATRWDTQLGAPGQEVELGVGSMNGTTVGIDLGVDRGALISGSSIDEADEIGEVIALSMGSAWSPNELTVVEINHRNAVQHDAMQQLPHFAGAFGDRGPDATARFVERLRRAVTTDELSGKRLAVFVRGLAETELAAPGMVSQLANLAADTTGIHLIVTTALPLAAIDETIREACAIEVAIDRYGGLRRATIHDRDHAVRTPFVPNDLPSTAATEIDVTPFLFGRAPTPLERRLERTSNRLQRGPEHAASQLVEALQQLAEERNIAPQAPLVPVPLPQVVDADRLLERHRGDGVPIGLIEVADSTTPIPHWWQPGQGGSIVAIGSPRAEMRRILDVIVCGIVDRFGTDDLAIAVIEQQAGRRAALGAVPHLTAVAPPDQTEAVRRMVDELHEEMLRRRDDTSYRAGDHQALLLLARDLERLPQDICSVLAALAEHGEGVGINVIATAGRPADAEALLTTSAAVFVGSLSDPDDYQKVGIERPERFESIPGRCHTNLGGKPVMLQLAGLGTTLDQALAARSDT